MCLYTKKRWNNLTNNLLHNLICPIILQVKGAGELFLITVVDLTDASFMTTNII